MMQKECALYHVTFHSMEGCEFLLLFIERINTFNIMNLVFLLHGISGPLTNRYFSLNINGVFKEKLSYLF